MNQDLQDRSANQPDPTTSPIYLDDEGAEPKSMTIGRAIVIFVVGLVVLASFGVWGYAYSGQADRPTPDTLDDPRFAALAASICEGAMAEFDTLPDPLEAADNVERAEQIRISNTIFSTMIDDLEAATTGTARDQQIIGSWLADWRTFVQNRADYADRFELDENARFYVASVGGERLERRIPRFADTNLISICSPPSDIG